MADFIRSRLKKRSAQKAVWSAFGDRVLAHMREEHVPIEEQKKMRLLLNDALPTKFMIAECDESILLDPEFEHAKEFRANK